MYSNARRLSFSRLHGLLRAHCLARIAQGGRALHCGHHLPVIPGRANVLDEMDWVTLGQLFTSTAKRAANVPRELNLSRGDGCNALLVCAGNAS